MVNGKQREDCQEKGGWAGKMNVGGELGVGLGLTDDYDYCMG